MAPTDHIHIDLLPDGRFVLSSNPKQALSEEDLRAALVKAGNSEIADNLVFWAKERFRLLQFSGKL